MDDAELSCDTILRGRLELWQPREGYRFSVDPLLLIDFVAPPYGRLIDFCAGVGVVGLGLLSRDPLAQATLVELQPRLATLAQRNAGHNGMAERAIVRQQNLVTDQLGEMSQACDVAVANPPYRRTADGPVSPNREVATAQHELTVTLPELVARMSQALKPQGRAALVYPAERVGELLTQLEARRLKPERLRMVHPRAAEPANRVLVEARKDGRRPLRVEPPLVLRTADAYTDEARRILGEP